MLIGRRSFLTGLLAAPIIVRPGILMPVWPIEWGYDVVWAPTRVTEGGGFGPLGAEVTYFKATAPQRLFAGDMVSFNIDGTIKSWPGKADNEIIGIYAGHVERLPHAHHS